MDGADGNPADDKAPEDDPFRGKAVPFPPGLVRQLDALAAEVGAVDPDAPIIGPVALSESAKH